MLSHGEGFGDGVHHHPLRVYYEDTDAGGVVYYANYLKFAERARTEMLRDLGIDHSELMDNEGVAFAVRHCTMDFLAPARLDDVLDDIDRERGGQTLERQGSGPELGRGAHRPLDLPIRSACRT